MRKNILKLFTLFCFIFLICNIFFMPVLADVGNNNRYDISSSETSSNSSSNSSSSDNSILVYILFEMFGPIPGIIILAIVAIILYRLKKTGKLDKINNETRIQREIKYSDVVDNTLPVSEEIRKTDPNFSYDMFISFAKEVFIKIQNAWSQRNWKVIRPFESNELFQVHSNQLDEYIKSGKINIVEKISIQKCVLRSFDVDGTFDVLKVELHSIMRDYVIDENTKKVLESDPNRDWYMKYILTFKRKSGVKTKLEGSLKSTTNCPNCGAPTNITSSGQCDYCDSVITTGEYDWVLSDITSFK